MEDLDTVNNLSIAEMLKLQEEEDEKEIQRILGKTKDGRIERRLKDDENDNLVPSGNLFIYVNGFLCYIYIFKKKIYL